MPSFKTSKRIILQPGDDNIAYNFKFTQNSSTNASDGWLPYGATMTSAAVTCETEDGTAVVSIFNTTPTFNALTNIVTCELRYPTEGPGRYYLRFLIGLDNVTTIEADYGRVEAMDLP